MSTKLKTAKNKQIYVTLFRGINTHALKKSANRFENGCL
jgi:hypothetical protein